MTSDSDSCACIVGGHPKGEDHLAAKPVNGTEATRQCLMGGTDIDSGGTYRGNLAKAVEDGELDVKYARLGLKNSYKMRMMMGLFDPTGTTVMLSRSDRMQTTFLKAASLLQCQTSTRRLAPKWLARTSTSPCRWRARRLA